jgi:hypothetical protein
VHIAEECDKPIFEKNISYAIDIPSDPFIATYRGKKFFIPMWNKLYKRSAIASIKFDPELFGMDDGYFNLCAAPFIKKHVKISAGLYYWRRHNNSCSVSNTFLTKRMTGISRLVEKINHFSEETSALSSEEKMNFCSKVVAISSMSEGFSGYAGLVYTSKMINDLYSRGFIELKYLDFSEKIAMASLIVVGKIQKWL